MNILHFFKNHLASDVYCFLSSGVSVKVLRRANTSSTWPSHVRSCKITIAPPWIWRLGRYSYNLHVFRFLGKPVDFSPKLSFECSDLVLILTTGYYVSGGVWGSEGQGCCLKTFNVFLPTKPSFEISFCYWTPLF